jgi:hypothetical protein
MTQALNVELPDVLLGFAKDVFKSLGKPVIIPPEVIARIDRVIDESLVTTLLDVRERERAASPEALKLRIR